METHCPHCTQGIEIDDAALAALSQNTHIACPTCGGAVAVRRQPATARPSPHRATPGLGQQPRGATPAGGLLPAKKHTLAVVGSLALLLVGGLGIWLATRKKPDSGQFRLTAGQPEVQAVELEAFSGTKAHTIAVPKSFADRLSLRTNMTGVGTGLRFDLEGNPLLTLDPKEEPSRPKDLLTPRGGILKLSGKTGESLWAVSHAALGAVGGYAAESQCKPGFEFDEKGDLAFVGEVQTERGKDLVIAKIDGRAGNVLWKTRYNRSPDGDDLSVATHRSWIPDEAGNVLVSVHSGGPYVPVRNIKPQWPTSPRGSFSAAAILFAAHDGTEIWEHRVPSKNPTDGFSFLKTGKEGTMAVLSVTDEKPKLVSLANTDGRARWEISSVFRNLNLPMSDGLFCQYKEDKTDAWAFIPESGAVKWQTKANLGRFESNPDIAACSNGDYWVVWDLSVVCKKLAANDGHTICESKPFGERGKIMELYGEGSLIRIFPDANGDCIVSWFVRSAVGSAEPNLAKISGKDGAVLWQKKVDHPVTFSSSETAKIDRNGNLAAVFRETNLSSQATKFANATGDILWQKNLPLGHCDFSVDPTGNLWVVDRQKNSLIKLRGDDGNIELHLTFPKNIL